jgi:uncharacterized membrane protein
MNLLHIIIFSVITLIVFAILIYFTNEALQEDDDYDENTN